MRVLNGVRWVGGGDESRGSVFVETNGNDALVQLNDEQRILIISPL